ncbi:dihydroneopterin aldolase [Zhouia sp. PK063]|uniref:dihydroneopterin aldolase n=1 Tax=Zhouia sp. PK063 TaxID=3373602 RepID=UPI0037A64CF3
MGKIRVTNIQVYAYHGCLVEEGKIGSDYRVDVEVSANLQPSAISDNLQDTVDYVLINRIVKDEMAIRSKLLEHVAQRIINRIFNEVSIANAATVEVSKINPPIGGNVEMVTIEISQTRN